MSSALIIAQQSEDHADPVKGKPKVTISTDKSKYRMAENVEFTLSNSTKNAVDVSDAIYIIEKRFGTEGKEFYTSKKGPFKKPKIRSGHKKKWNWDLWDNERENKATPGRWRIKMYIPSYQKKPLVAFFTIKP